MKKRQYVELARAAVSDFAERGVPLTESVKSAAADMSLNDEQTRRLAEFTNTMAHLHLFDKQADDKYIQFDLVDPEALTTPAAPVCEEKVAAETDPRDFFLGLTNERTPQIKEAHDQSEATEYLAATSPVDPSERPYANGRNYKTAMRMQKLARELELETMVAYERYLEGVRKLAFELERTPSNDKTAFVANVRGIYPEAAESVLVQIDVVNPKLQLSEVKEAAALPWSSPLTDRFGDLIVDRQRVLDTGRGYKKVAAKIGA
jgi:hypothetical protein